MNDYEKDSTVSMDMLKKVTGGVGSDDIEIRLEHDPLQDKFTEFWNTLNKGPASENCTEFQTLFIQWAREGCPANIAGWYNSLGIR